MIQMLKKFSASLVLFTLFFGFLPEISFAQEPIQSFQQNLQDFQFDYPHYRNLLKQASKDPQADYPVIVRLNVNKADDYLFSELEARERYMKKIKRSQDKLEQDLTEFEVKDIVKFKYIPHMAFDIPGYNLAHLFNLDSIVFVEKNITMETGLDDSLELITSGEPPNFDFGGITGEGQFVAILDGGFQTDHEFLEGRFVEEFCFSESTDSGNHESLCPDGSVEQVGTGSSLYCTDPSNDCEHGTHVAGIAAGSQDMSPDDPSRGVAPNVDLILGQVFYRETSSCGSYADGRPKPTPCLYTSSDLIQRGLGKVLELSDMYDIAAVNLSLGSGKYQDVGVCHEDSSYVSVVESLKDAGVATVVSSMNNGYVDGVAHPACIEDAVAVGNVENDDTVYSTSNSGSLLDLFAPGTRINSSISSGIYSDSPISAYSPKIGTSMASPHVAGLFALYREAYPDWSVDEILDVLKVTGLPVTDEKAPDITRPRVDLGPSFVDITFPGPPLVEPYVILNSDTVEITWEPYEQDRGDEGIFVPSSYELDIDLEGGIADIHLPLWSETSYTLFTGRYADGTGVNFKVRPVFEDGSYGFWSEVDFELQDPLDDEDGVDFRDAALTGLSVDPDTQEIRFILKGEEAEVGDIVIDMEDEIVDMEKAFLAALAIPNYKHFVSLDILSDEFGEPYGSARTIAPFEDTDLARHLFEADVELKFDMFTEPIIGDDRDEGISADWVDLLKESPYWRSIYDSGYWFYPRWQASAEIVPGEIDAYVEDGTVFLESATMDLDYRVDFVSLDISHAGFVGALSADIYARLSHFEVILNDRLEAAAESFLERLNGDDPEFDQIRDAYRMIAAAQWYKELELEDKPYQELIDSEDLTGFEASPSFDREYWDDQAWQYLGTEQFYGIRGEVIFDDVRGGVSMPFAGIESEEPITEDQSEIINTALEEAYVEIDGEYYFGLGGVESELSDLVPSSLMLNPYVPTNRELTTISLSLFNNSPYDQTDSFDVDLYVERVLEGGDVSREWLTELEVDGLDSYESVVLEADWTPSALGDFNLIAVVDEAGAIFERNDVNNELLKVVEVLSQFPVTRITRPSNSSVVGAYNVELAGYSEDALEGVLSGELLSWESDVDGELGTGGYLLIEEMTLGTHLITLTAENERGHEAIDQVEIHVVEPEFPFVEIESPVDDQELYEGVEYLLSAESYDIEEGDLCLSESSFITWSSSLDGVLSYFCEATTELSLGEHVLTFSAESAAGLISESSIVVNVVDGSPIVEFLSPLEGEEFVEGSLIVFEALASDSQDGDLSGDIEWYSSLDGYIGSGSYLETSLSPGLHELVASVTDSDGLSSGVERLLNVYFAPPEVSITSPLEAAEFDLGELVRLEGSALDLRDGVILDENLVWESSLQGYLGSGGVLETSDLLGGIHTISLIATDSDGAEGITLVSDVLINPGLPSGEILAPLDGESFFYGYDVSLEGLGSDDLDGVLSGDSLVWSSSIDGELGTGGSLVLSDLSPGEHVIQLSVMDSEGWSVESRVAITIQEPNDPVLSLFSPGAGRTFEGSDGLVFEASAIDVEDGDISSSIVWGSSIDGELGVGALLADLVLTPGLHEITALVTDLSGGTVDLSFDLTILDLAPEISFVSPEDRSIFAEGDLIRFEAVVSDAEDGDLSGDSLTWLNDADEVLATGALYEVDSLSPGTHQIRLQAVDSFGNLSETMITVIVQAEGSFILDTFNTGELTASFEFGEGGGEDFAYFDLPQDAEVVSAQVEVSGSGDVQFTEVFGALIDSEDNIQSVYEGGLYSSKPELVDIDLDGDLDLFVGHQGLFLLVYENIGDLSTPIWSFVNTFSLSRIGIPEFADLDNDGDQDLIVGSTPGGIGFYENNGSGGVLPFESVVDPYLGFDTGYNASPEFVDIDLDGDLDAFFGNSEGRITHYIYDDGWVHVTDFYSSIDVGEYSDISFVNLDDDYDLDLIIGSSSDGELHFYKNIGSEFSANFEDFGSIGSIGALDLSRSSSFGDLNNDGLVDIVYGGHSGGVHIDYNIGTLEEYSFASEGELINFFDVGSNSRVAFTNIDGDFDFDMFITNSSEQISLYSNQGSVEEPIWTWETDDYFGDLFAYSNQKLVFVNFDEDDDMDAVLSHESTPNLIYLRNIGSSDLAEWEVADSFFAGVELDDESYLDPSVPVFVDIDSDEDLDFFIGNGNIYGDGHQIMFYRNVGIDGADEWVLESEDYTSFSDYSGGHFGFLDFDEDGDLDFIGSQFDNISLIRNVGSIYSPVWEHVSDLFFSDFRFERLFTNRLSPTFVDINNDSLTDMFLGNSQGGLFHIENQGSVVDLSLDAGDDGVLNWEFDGTIAGVELVPDFSSDVVDYLSLADPLSIASVPLRFASASVGEFELSGLNVQYYWTDVVPPVLGAPTLGIAPPSVPGPPSPPPPPSPIEAYIDEPFLLSVEVTDNTSIESVEVTFEDAVYPMVHSEVAGVYEVELTPSEVGLQSLEFVAVDASGLEASLISEISVLSRSLDLTFGDDLSLLPENPADAELSTLAATVYNFGDLDALGTQIDLIMDGEFYSSQIVDVLAGANLAVEFEWIAVSGEHELSLIVDSTELFVEIDEENNQSSLLVEVLDSIPPSIDAVSLSEEYPTEGDVVSLSVLASDNVGIDRVNVIWQGQEMDLTYDEVSGNHVGDFDMAFAGDTVAVITAYDAQGLVSVLEYGTFVAPLLADLSIHPYEMTVDPEDYERDELVVFTLNVQNNGGGDAVDAVLRLTQDDEVQVESIFSVPAGGALEVPLEWTASASASDLIFVVDPDNAISESDEANNSFALERVIGESATPPQVTELLVSPNPVSLGEDFLVQTLLEDDTDLSSIEVSFLEATYPLVLNAETGYYETTLSADLAGDLELIVNAWNELGLMSSWLERVTVQESLAELSVQELSVDLPLAALDGPQIATANLLNTGALDAEGVLAEFYLDGIKIDETFVDLAMDTPTLHEFEFEPILGVQSLEVILDPLDAVSEIDESNNSFAAVYLGQDLIAPEITELTIDEPVYVDGDFNVQVRANDNLSIDRVEVEVDGVVYEATFVEEDVYEASLSIPVVGDAELIVRAVDASGLQMELWQLVEVNALEADLSLSPIDLTLEPLPLSHAELMNAQILAKNEGGSDVFGAQVVLNIDGLEVDSLLVDLPAGGSSLVDLNWPAVYGEHDLEIILDPFGAVFESDETNNLVSREIFVFDTVAPSTPSPVVTPEDWTADDTPLVTWSPVVDDYSLAGYEYSLNGGEWISVGLDLSVVLPPLDSGVHTVEVRALDAAGNVSGAGLALAKVDLDAPRTPLLLEEHSGPDWTQHNTPWLSWENPGDLGSGVVTYEYQLNEDLPLNIGFVDSYHPTLPSGVHAMKIRALDALGQASDWSNEIVVQIDVDAPLVAVITSESHPDELLWSNNRVPEFEWTSPEDISLVEGYYTLFDTHEDTVVDSSDLWTVENSMVMDNLITDGGDPVPVSDGVWYLHVAAQDAVGLIGETAHYKVMIDTTAPYTEHDRPELHPREAFTINFSADDYHVGVGETWVSLDGAAFEIATSVDIENPYEYRVEYYSVDLLGNTEEVKVLTSEFERSLVLSHEPFVIGEAASITVSGAVPGDRVVLLTGTGLGDACYPNPDGVCLGIDRPKLLARGRANADGVATFGPILPPELEGRSFVLQAFVGGGILAGEYTLSNVVEVDAL